MLGGDHSIADPNMTAVAAHHGPGTVGVIHFDAHADTAEHLAGVTRSHGTPMRLVVDRGSIPGDRFLQVGLRGFWPEPPEFAWMREVGFRWWTAYELDERGFDTCLDEVIEAARGWEHVFLSIDIDSLDPAFAPGTGTPVPGGLTTRELGRATRRITAELPGLRGRARRGLAALRPERDHGDRRLPHGARGALGARAAAQRAAGRARARRPRQAGQPLNRSISTTIAAPSGGASRYCG